MARKQKETSREPSKEYMEDKQIRIPMGKARKKCINIFAVYMLGNEMRPSRGIAVDINSGDSKKVRYTAKRVRGGADIEVSTEPGVYELPPMMLVQTSTGIPLKRTDGEVVWRSGGPVPLQNGRGVIEARGNIEDVKRCRLFLENDADYFDYRFVHPLYREG